MKCKQVIVARGREGEKTEIINRLNQIDGIVIDVSNGEKFTIINAEFPDLEEVRFKLTIVKSLLITRKFEYIYDRIKISNMSLAVCTLLSSLVYFDNIQEMKQLSRIIGNTDVYSLDGIYNFRMGEIVDSWNELVELTNSLLLGAHTETDIYNVAGFMMASRLKGEKSIFIADYPSMLITNVSKGGLIDVLNLYDNAEFNLLNAIIAECPTEVIVEKDTLHDELVSTLKNFVKIKMI